ncbi:hypothetical protein PK28_07640 [Hymenobacter sp. DG25B]|nr:hypothetical protein PK28_07640 [Hymenobacter sp. DG25B]
MVLLILALASCQSNPEVTQVPTAPAPQPKLATGSALPADTATPQRASEMKQSVALTSNALQLVAQPSGSTTEIPLGMPQEELVALLNKVLAQKVASVGINSECGVGPLKMATWGNGLTVAFQQKKAGNWLFAGWSVGAPAGTSPKPTTMAGVGIGSTRAELESAYVIKRMKTSLGQEFSTADGLYGILDGPGPEARITSMWSGVSCVFR